MSMTPSYQEQLINSINKATSDDGKAWLQQTMQALRDSTDTANDLLTFSAMARRKLGNEAFGDDAPGIDTPDGKVKLAHWIVGDAGRIVLLMEACKQPAEGNRWENRMFRSGDETERSAITQALVLLDEPGSLKALAQEAGRGNSLALYASMALNNPYPAAYYSDHEFNQVVLKSLFTGLPISRIAGLRRRSNAELSKMCEDYIDEREAAGRSVPVDIWLAVAPYATDYGKAMILRYLDNEETHHRYFAARALLLSGQFDAIPDLAARIDKESVPVVKKVFTEMQLLAAQR